MGGIVVAEIELFLLEQSGAKKRSSKRMSVTRVEKMVFLGFDLRTQLKNPRRQIFTETDSDLKRNNNTKRR